MPIVPPRLDDRSYDDLVEELLARIPAHTPEYTNPRESDPGRTLIELFAWLGDALLYRVNLVPERQRLVFLRLLGIPLNGAAPAHGVVGLTLGDTDPVPQRLRAGARVKAPVPFETLAEVTVQPVEGRVYTKRRLTAEEESATADVLPGLVELYRVGGEARSTKDPKEIVTRYVTTQVFVQASPDGLDLVGETVDATAWVALLAPKPDQVSAVRAALADGKRLQIGVVPALRAPDPFRPEAASPPPEVAWEVASKSTKPSGEPVYQELEVFSDGTSGLTQGGVFDLGMPGVEGIGLPANDTAVDIDAGVGDRPPRIDDRDAAARLVTWVRLRPRSRLARLDLAWVGVNAVAVDQRTTLRLTVVGQGTGAADQEVAMPVQSVDPTTFALEVEEPGLGYRAWRPVFDIAQAARDERAFVLDPEAGVLRFGDGIRGKVPEVGMRIRVRTARAGGGVAGNLPPGQLTGLTEAFDPDGRAVARKVVVVQPLSMAGGAAAETLAEAERRIPAYLRHRDRAVTEADFVVLAAGTPGVRVGRVEVLRGFKPHQRKSDVPGAVSVMVLPEKEALLAPNPRPDRRMIAAVHAWLSTRMPVTTELYVIGCEYVSVAVSVGIEVRSGFGRDETVAAVRAAIRRYLWSLAPGGPFEPAGGWPLGRPVRDRELEVIVARVPGVDEVLGLRVFTKDAAGTAWKRLDPLPGQAAQLDLSAWQLPELLGVAVAVDAEAPRTMDGTPNPHASAAATPVPVVPEIC